MNLAMQLLLGGLRRGSSVPSVVGEGFTLTTEEFKAQHGTFYGSPNVNVTGLVIDDISIFPTPDTNPKAIKATTYGNVRWSGSRTFNIFGYAVPNPFLRPRYTDLDYRFVVTYADGTPLENDEGLVYPNTTDSLNPYTDQYGYNLTVLLRDPTQQYKITQYVYAKDGDLIRGASKETIVGPFEVPVLEEVWYSHDTGNDANDGGDLLGLHLGTVFPAGSFDNSTRTLTSTGAFASYDQVAASAGNRSNRFNKIKLLTATEAGFSPVLAEIESKISDDAVVLKNFLGANYTGITSSSGPKLTVVRSGNGYRYLKSGGDYIIDGAIGYNAPSMKAFIGVASGSKPRLIRDTTGGFIDLTSGSSANLSGQPDWFLLSNVKLDCQFVNSITTGRPTGENGARNGAFIIDRVDMVDSGFGQCFSFDFSGSLAGQHVIRLIHYGSYIRNLENPEGTISKTIGMYFVVNPGAEFSSFANKYEVDNTTNNELYHAMYPTGVMDHAHVAFCDFGDAGNGTNFAVNMNMLPKNGDNQVGMSIVGNYVSRNFTYGFDLAKTNIPSEECYANDAYYIGNRCASIKGLILQGTTQSSRVAFNEVWRPENDAAFQLFQHLDGWMPAGVNARYYIDNNKVYGQRLLNQDDTFPTDDYYEVTDNDIQHGGTLTAIKIGDINFSTYESKFARNNIVTVNQADVAEIGNVGYTLSEFNAVTEGDNTAIPQERTDPANGDFSTASETYFTDFSTDTIGQLPANTTLKRNAVAGDYQVVDQSGTRVLRYLATTGSGQRGLAFPLESSGVVEIYTEIMEGNAGLFRSTVYAIDSPVDEYGGLLSDDVNILQTFRRGSGTFSQIASVGYNVLPDRYYALLFKVTPGSPNTIQAKAWDLSLGETEPVSWMLSNTNANLTLVDGWLGLGASTLNVTGYCRKIGIGINGQPAPRS